jgi:hypothetical protein
MEKLSRFDGLSDVMNFDAKTEKQVAAKKRMLSAIVAIRVQRKAAELTGSVDVTGETLQRATEIVNREIESELGPNSGGSRNLTVPPTSTSRRTNEAWKARQKARKEALGQKSNSQ